MATIAMPNNKCKVHQSDTHEAYLYVLLSMSRKLSLVLNPHRGSIP